MGEEVPLTTQRSTGRTPGRNSLPYDMNPDPERITPLGWSSLTETEARNIIKAASRRRAITQED